MYLDTVLPQVEAPSPIPPTAAALIASKSPIPELPKAAALVNGTESLPKLPPGIVEPEVEANKTDVAKDDQKQKTHPKTGDKQEAKKNDDPQNSKGDEQKKPAVNPQLVAQPKNETN